ncbi:MAG: hypothetical protein WAX77_00045 [Methylococcaceae bacterium]
MKPIAILFLFLAVLLISTSTFGVSFAGNWIIDLRTTEEKKNNVECGFASFHLFQKNQNILGTHRFYTSYCGKLNEGGFVIGKAKGSKAVLFVTSGRNGAVVEGKAVIKNNFLYWQVSKEIKPSNIEGDSALILYKGILNREK